MLVSLGIAAFAAALVGIATTVVVRLQREEVKASGERIANATERAANAEARAAEAKLELERFKAPRELNPQDEQNIVAAVNRFSGQQFGITTYWDLKEAVDFSNQLLFALHNAGWIFIKPEEGKQSFLFAGTTGVQIWIHVDADPSVKEAANALASALEEIGQAPSLREMDPSSPKDNKIALNIGTKP